MIKQTLSVVALSALLSASSTMCYKKDHFDPETIESIALKGGTCGGKLSVNDMKSKGYIVQDIKISAGDAGMNYIYIFKKPGSTNTTLSATPAVPAGSVVLTKENLKQHLKAFQEEEKKKAEEKKKVDNLAAGKKRYEELCRKCHGDGSISAYGVARPLTSLSKKEFTLAIGEFVNDQRKGSMVILMKPYANLLGESDINNIHTYLQTLKK